VLNGVLLFITYRLQKSAGLVAISTHHVKGRSPRHLHYVHPRRDHLGVGSLRDPHRDAIDRQLDRRTARSRAPRPRTLRCGRRFWYDRQDAGSITAGTKAGEVAATSIACRIFRRHMNSWMWPDAPRQSMASE
jgi:hypothetical protein